MNNKKKIIALLEIGPEKKQNNIFLKTLKFRVVRLWINENLDLKHFFKSLARVLIHVN